MHEDNDEFDTGKVVTRQALADAFNNMNCDLSVQKRPAQLSENSKSQATTVSVVGVTMAVMVLNYGSKLTSPFVYKILLMIFMKV